VQVVAVVGREFVSGSYDKHSAVEGEGGREAGAAAHPQIKRIARHRQQRKESNRRVNSKPGLVPFVPERQKHVVREEKSVYGPNSPSSSSSSSGSSPIE
jgi:hypothetical protein